MVPAQVQKALLSDMRIGIFASRTLGLVGVHGAGTTGTQGMGVNTPNAAAVALATAGLAIDWHIPNGRILTKGLLSIIFAPGVPSSTRFTGNTFSVEGATPNEHCSSAPAHTAWGISFSSSLFTMHSDMACFCRIQFRTLVSSFAPLRLLYLVFLLFYL